MNVALPPLSVAVPRAFEPSRNVIEPVGVPLPGAMAVTVAVKVTDWPKTEGFVAEVTTLVVPAWLTDWVSAAEVLVVKLRVAVVDRDDRIRAGRQRLGGEAG